MLGGVQLPCETVGSESEVQRVLGGGGPDAHFAPFPLPVHSPEDAHVSAALGGVSVPDMQLSVIEMPGLQPPMSQGDHCPPDTDCGGAQVFTAAHAEASVVLFIQLLMPSRTTRHALPLAPSLP